MSRRDSIPALSYPARENLGFYPHPYFATPLVKLDRLSHLLGGPEIFIKRDDQTGLAGGGNKTRKLEFVMADALTHDCDHLITLGGPQSNHCRQTAAAAATYGLGCTLVLRGEPPLRKAGNLLLDELLGAQVLWAGDRDRQHVAQELLPHLRAAGHRPYLIPLGASDGIGALGYVNAMQELLGQLRSQERDIDLIVLASSSGGTQAGLALGAAIFDYPIRILGISIDAPANDLAGRVHQIAVEGLNRLLPRHDALRAMITEKLRIEVNADYLGGGYAVVGESERHAIRLLARTEGIIADPVYTGRALGGLIDLIRKGAIERGQRILFWHTGGAPALSAFAEVL